MHCRDSSAYCPTTETDMGQNDCVVNPRASSQVLPVTEKTDRPLILNFPEPAAPAPSLWTATSFQSQLLHLLNSFSSHSSQQAPGKFHHRHLKNISRACPVLRNPRGAQLTLVPPPPSITPSHFHLAPSAVPARSPCLCSGPLRSLLSRCARLPWSL